VSSLHDTKFPVRVKVGGVWLWLHFPPGATRLTLTKDRRVAFSVVDPALAEWMVQRWEETEGRQVEGWQCVPANPKDGRVLASGG
jgi:hypothetical protein